jgi:hypothetical protein
MTTPTPLLKPLIARGWMPLPAATAMLLPIVA